MAPMNTSVLYSLSILRPARQILYLDLNLRRPCRGKTCDRNKTTRRCAAVKSKYYRLYLNSGKLALAAMYLRRDRVVGRIFAAALAHVSTAATPPALAAQNLGAGLWRPCRGQAFGGALGATVRKAPA